MSDNSFRLVAKVPSKEDSAAFAALSEPAEIRSSTASAAVKSILLFKKALLVNSPGSACLIPSIEITASRTLFGARFPPCPWNSTTSSPV